MRPAFVLSVAIALVLNGILLAGLATSAQKWRVSARPQRQVTWVTAVTSAGVQAEAKPAPAATQSPSPALAPLPPVAPAVAAPREVASVAAGASRSMAHDAGNDVRFYAYAEVDQAAEPDSDWNLDAALLDGAGVKLLVFDVFISETGEVVACTILRPNDLPNDTRRLLEDRLRHTTLRPAMRAGAAVPSVRRIELSVQ